MRPLGKMIVGTLALAGIGLIVAGGWLVVQRDTGARARARVTGCVGSGGLHNARTDCTGTWVVGGSLVGGNGHVVVGPVDGADLGDVGHTIDVTLSGGTAYSRSLRLPIILAVLGLAVLGLIGWALWGPKRARARRPPRPV